MTELHLITAWWNRFARFYLFGLLILGSFFSEPAWAKDANLTLANLARTARPITAQLDEG